MAPGRPAVVGRITHRQPRFGRDDYLGAMLRKPGDNRRLRGAPAIEIGRINQGNTGIPRTVKNPLRFAEICARPETTGPEPQNGYTQIRVSWPTILHDVYCLIRHSLELPFALAWLSLD